MSERGLFKGAAHYYEKYRVKYPQEFFDYIAKEFHLNGKGRLLDLGCGTGQIAIPLAKHFAHVIGLDPEEEMLTEAKKVAEEKGVSNISWSHDSAENIGPKLGRFRLITMGRSFHWMDQKLVLEKSYELLEKRGGLVIVSPDAPPGKDGWRIDEDSWKEVRKDVVKKYLGTKRRAGNGLYKEPNKRFEALLTESFGDSSEWRYCYSRKLNLDEAYYELYSTSYFSPDMLGARLSEFEKEIRSALLNAEPSGIFEEHITLQVLIARKA